jgi:hypothetical protein
MKKNFKRIFWFLLITLIVFTVVFATPILSFMVSSQILELAGCKPSGFDQLARCAEGSWASRFIPLGSWLSILFAPFIFFRYFWDVFLSWAFLTLVFGLLAIGKRKPAQMECL